MWGGIWGVLGAGYWLWDDAMLICDGIYRIQTWALEEARRRLEAEGILPDPSTKG